MSSRRNIAVIPGDGIGPEVIQEGLRLLHALNQKYNLHIEHQLFDFGAERWLKEGVGLPKGTLADFERNYDAIYFGALGDPRIPDMAHGREILLGMRFGLDLYANIRPVKLLDARLTPIKNKQEKDIDLVVVRENTEDCYVSVGGNFKQGTPDEIAIDESIHTKKGVERILRFAFKLSEQRRCKLTLSDKSNAVRFSGGLWQRTFEDLKGEYPHVATNHLFVDVMAMELVRSPEKFDVIVTSNLFGDILTDLGAALCGGLGIAHSANLHPGKIGLFEPVHGSAPDIAGKGIANPLAALLTLGSMLHYLGFGNISQAIETAVCSAVVEGCVTPDMNGNNNTRDVSDYVTRKTLEHLNA